MVIMGNINQLTYDAWHYSYIRNDGTGTLTPDNLYDPSGDYTKVRMLSYNESTQGYALYISFPVGWATLQFRIFQETLKVRVKRNRTTAWSSWKQLI